MDPASQSWAVIVGWSIVLLFIAFGVGLMSSRATNIERPTMVGAFVTIGGFLAGLLMYRAQASGGPNSWWQIFGFALISFVFYGWGMLFDYALGPAPLNREADEDTFGAHLSD